MLENRERRDHTQAYLEADNLFAVLRYKAVVALAKEGCKERLLGFQHLLANVVQKSVLILRDSSLLQNFREKKKRNTNAGVELIVVGRGLC